MNENIKSYSQAANQLGYAVNHECLNISEVKLMKSNVQESYNSWAHMIYDKTFLNWGLWDKKIVDEYLGLKFKFSTICTVQDIYPQILLYYLIRPLIKFNFFDKRLLDIGCGNGVGLKASCEMLGAKYALGVDLVHKLVTNGNRNFYKENEINYIQSDAEQLPLANESFDIITNLESSHLYPRVEHFYSEVERVLAPGGFFCYADIHIDNKPQSLKLEAFVNSRKNLKIIQKHDITKMVQAAIYKRLIENEDGFYKHAQAFFGHDKQKMLTELPSLTSAMGLSFLPWWKIWFKNPELRIIAKNARKDKYWGSKYFFYYIIQKGVKCK